MLDDCLIVLLIVYTLEDKGCMQEKRIVLDGIDCVTIGSVWFCPQPHTETALWQIQEY